jgi:N-acetylgalactosamine-6-sulfatase
MDSDSTWVHSSSRLAVDETIDFWKRNQDKDKPLFVNLWLKDPHTPLWPTDEQRAPYKDFSEDKETYYAVLTDADYHIGRLLGYLEKMNVEENTLIIFSSDNGPAGWGPSKIAGSTGGLRGRKVDIFQGGVNVPFIAYQKGKTAVDKTDSTSVLSAVDLLPTFCELADIDLPKDYHPDGESFAEIFSGETFQRTKPLFWDWRFSRENSKNQWAAGAVRFGDWKLLTNKDRTRTELYNIVNDPFEKNNLVEQEIEKTKELSMMLAVWQNELPR